MKRRLTARNLSGAVKSRALGADVFRDRLKLPVIQQLRINLKAAINSCVFFQVILEHGLLQNPRVHHSQ